jgi:phosphate transport system permease protein
LLSANELAARDTMRKGRSRLYIWLVGGVGVAVCAMVIGLIATIIVQGMPAISWEFLSSAPDEGMTSGGIWPMIRGSLLLMGGTLVVVLPLGILGGICLAEYAGDSKATKLMRACVTSLAGTPSIVFGLFGLAIFVLMFKLGFSLLAGWFTLSLFALPVIVLSTENAIKAVPDSLVEAGLALGLSKWQTIAKIVLPHALPGIMTGVVLSSGRAAGEAPPIFLTAGVYFATGALTWDWAMLRKPVANLPYHLAEGYRQGGVIPAKIIWGTCLTLMVFVLLINLGAIIVRARMRWKTQL